MLKKAITALAICLLAVSVAKAVTVTVDDIIKLHQEGLSVEVIKTFITSSGQKFELTAQDVLRMKKAGVPEEVIELMLKTLRPVETAPPAAVGKDGEFEPGFKYEKRYHSVFSFQVFKKKVVHSERVLAVGKRDPLRNTANRGGTLFLTDDQLVMYDMEGDERFRLKYKDITELKIEARYKDEVEARYHSLDAKVLWIYFKRDGQEFYIKVFTLPPPEKKKNMSTYGSVQDIAAEIRAIGGKVNPKIAAPVKTR